jgi:hypothetical protein
MLDGEGGLVVDVPAELPEVPGLDCADAPDDEPLPDDGDGGALPEAREPLWLPAPVRDGVVGVVDVAVGVVGVGEAVGVVLLALVVVVDVVAAGMVVVSATNSALPALTVALALVEPDEDEVPASRLLSWSSAAVRVSSAWLTASCAELGSSVASSWPWATCWPCLTLTCSSVPLVLKFATTSVAGWTLPVPETVDWTTPRWAVTT